MPAKVLYFIAAIIFLFPPSLRAEGSFGKLLRVCLAKVLHYGTPKPPRPSFLEYLPEDFQSVNLDSGLRAVWPQMATVEAALANRIAAEFIHEDMYSDGAMTLVSETLRKLVADAKLARVHPDRHFGEVRDYEARNFLNLNIFREHSLLMGRMLTPTAAHLEHLSERIEAEMIHVASRQRYREDSAAEARKFVATVNAIRQTFYLSTTRESIPTTMAMRSSAQGMKEMLFTLATAPQNSGRVLYDAYRRMDSVNPQEDVGQLHEQWADAFYGVLQSEYFGGGHTEITTTAFAGIYKAIFGIRLSPMPSSAQLLDLMTTGQSRFKSELLARIMAANSAANGFGRPGSATGQ